MILFAISLVLDDLPIDDANTIFFVSGYIGRSISRRRKCSAWKKLLVNGNKPCNIDYSIPDENKQLFLQVVRGGLYAPTKFIYAVTALSVQFYTAINADATVKCMLFASSNRRADFTLTTTNVSKAQDHANLVIQKCASEHKLCVWLLRKKWIKAVECCKRCSCIAGVQ